MGIGASHIRAGKGYRARIGALVGTALLAAAIAWSATPVWASGPWSQQTSGTSNVLYAVSFVDATHGWAVGQAGTVLATTDGGNTWTGPTAATGQTASYYGPNDSLTEAGDLYGASFVDVNTGWVVGKGGLILVTHSGGEFWAKQTSGTTTDLTAVSFADANNGFAVGLNGVILQTFNGGGTWLVRIPGGASNLRGVAANPGGLPWAVGDGGELADSEDGGSSWGLGGFAPNQANLRAISFVDGKHGWAVGDGGTIMVTTDGTHWVSQVDPQNQPLYGVSFVDADHGWAVGPGAGILVTTDGGTTWTSPAPFLGNLNAVSFVDASHGWVVGDTGATPDIGLIDAYNNPPPVGSMGITPSSGPAGTMIGVSSVTACPAGSTFADIYLKDGSGATLASSQAGNFLGSGVWSGTVTVPSGTAVGSYFLTASCFGTSIKDDTQDYQYVAFTVTPPPPALTTITVTPANPSVDPGATQQFTATGTYSDGSTQNLTASVTWGSSTPSVATINSSGLATAVGSGSTTVTATSGAVSGSTTLNVASLVSIAVTPANPTIVFGASQQFTATGTYSDGSTQNLTGSVSWSSSSPSVATISSSGLASAVGYGTTTITATSGAVGGSTTLNVVVAPPTITSFSPTSGPVGTKVTINGAHLAKTTTVKVNGTVATFTVVSDNQLTAKVPKGAKTGAITVTTPTGTATSSTNFVVK